MKRRLEEDVDFSEEETLYDKTQSKFQSSLSFMEKKIEEYRKVFHLLCGLIDRVPRDVIFCIAKSYYDVWSIPENGFESIRPTRSLVPGKTKKDTSILVHITSFSEEANDTQIVILVVDFKENNAYSIVKASCKRYRIQNANPMMNIQFQIVLIRQLIIETQERCAGLDRNIMSYICSDNPMFRAILQLMNPFSALCKTYLHTADNEWCLSMLGAIFEYDKPEYTEESESSKSIASGIGKFTRSVALTTPYHIDYYDQDGDKLIPSIILYPLTLALSHHQSKRG